MKRKILIITLAAAVLVVAAVGGTLAYLTATTDAVVNTFTVGHITMTLLEAKVNATGEFVDENDNIVTNINDAVRVATNAYKIIPGATLSKDPQVTIKAGSEPCYVFVKIDNQLEATVSGSTELDIGSGWTPVGSSTNIYQYNAIVDASTADQVLPKVFTTITISGSVVNSTNIADLANKEIIVTAYAHQSANTNEIAVPDAALAFFAAP